MENIIDKLKKLINWYELLPENVKEFFYESIKKNIEDIYVNLENIKTNQKILINSNRDFFDNDKTKEINKRKQKLLWKYLFPQYWLINSELDKISEAELKILESGWGHDNRLFF